jgi:hypothetical protein
MDIALSQVTKLEGIATQDNGNYRQFTEFQDFVSAVRSIGTLEKNCTDALASFDVLQADTDGKVIVVAKGIDGEVQFTPNAAFRTALENVKTALTAAKTAVGAVQLPLP